MAVVRGSSPAVTQVSWGTHVRISPASRKVKHVALQTYNIKFKDGATQTITSLSPGISGDWMIFGDGSGEILRVPAKDVESVSRDGTPDREKRSPRTAAV